MPSGVSRSVEVESFTIQGSSQTALIKKEVLRWCGIICSQIPLSGQRGNYICIGNRLVATIVIGSKQSVKVLKNLFFEEGQAKLYTSRDPCQSDTYFLDASNLSFLICCCPWYVCVQGLVDFRGVPEHNTSGVGASYNFLTYWK